MLSKIKNWFLNLFKKAPVAVPAPTPTPITSVGIPPKVSPPPSPTMMKESAARLALVNLWMKDLGEYEDKGKNRSVMIDAINKRLGVPMGSPYCIGGLLVRGVEVFCKTNGLKNPVKMTAGTQDFWWSTEDKYKKAVATKLAKMGDIGILVLKDDPGHGHAFGFKEAETKIQSTVEYNTDVEGSRNGDGVYQLTRAQSGTETKRYRGSIDVIQMIMDANPYFFLKGV